MSTEYRSDMLGSPTKRPRKVDAQAAIEKMEAEIKEMARTLRALRENVQQGEVTEQQLHQAEARFAELLAEHQKNLELMHRAAKK